MMIDTREKLRRAPSLAGDSLGPPLGPDTDTGALNTGGGRRCAAALGPGPACSPSLGYIWQIAEMGLNTKQTWGKIMKNI